MDPIANLKEQLELAQRINTRFELEEPIPAEGLGAAIEAQTCDGERLAELVLALDEWMRKGGFSPWKAVK